MRDTTRPLPFAAAIRAVFDLSLACATARRAPVEEIKDETVKDNLTKEPTEDDIDFLFNHIPFQVEGVETVSSTVEVTPVRDFACVYGGVGYHFTTNKKQRVPIAMKDFLLQKKLNPKIKDVW